MEKKIIFWVVSLSLVAVALAILLPGGRQADPDPKLPWDVQTSTDGAVRVFHLTLGSSTLQDARTIFQMEGETKLFIGQSGKPTLETYFERVFLSGLRADFVLVLEADDAQLQEIYDRGSRISRTSDATRQVELNDADRSRVSGLPIRLINYIPYANLEENLIVGRFGQPSVKIKEMESGITQWIYPQRGFSIGLNPDGKELIQYMPPDEIAAFISQIEANNRAYEASQQQKS